MIKRSKKLSNIESKSACIEVFNPTRAYNVGKGNTYICSGLEFQPP